eukprot:758976-Hanusia_phi.AAC.3
MMRATHKSSLAGQLSDYNGKASQWFTWLTDNLARALGDDLAAHFACASGLMLNIENQELRQLALDLKNSSSFTSSSSSALLSSSRNDDQTFQQSPALTCSKVRHDANFLARLLTDMSG